MNWKTDQKKSGTRKRRATENTSGWKTQKINQEDTTSEMEKDIIMKIGKKQYSKKRKLRTFQDGSKTQFLKFTEYNGISSNLHERKPIPRHIIINYKKEK